MILEQQNDSKSTTLNQTYFDRKYRLNQIQRDISLLEVRFSSNNKLLSPANWLAVQDELGHAYDAMMRYGFTESTTIISKV